MSKQIPLFEIHRLTRVYEGAQLVKALDSISLNIYAGDAFGIIGQQKAGRSTLAKMLTGIETPTFGTVSCSGKKLSEMDEASLRQLRKKHGTIFNPPGLAGHSTVRENLMLAATLFSLSDKEASDRIAELSELCGITKLMDTKAASLTPLQTLSAALARTMTGQPESLILDGFLDGLEEEERLILSELIKTLSKRFSLTLILTSRSMKSIEELCTRAIVLDKGHAVECGNVMDIVKCPVSAAAKKLVYPENTPLEQYDAQGRRCARLAFDGTAAAEPVIAGLVEETGEMVSILCANTKSIGGIGFGQMIIELPEDTIGAQKVINYFNKKRVFVEEIR